MSNYIESMTPQQADTLMLVGKQAVGLALAFPTAGMSLAINCMSYDNYQRRWYPESITWCDNVWFN